MTLSDQIEDAKKGNAAAQKMLFDRLADPMMALCCRYVKNREDAEEILLDGFCKVGLVDRPDDRPDPVLDDKEATWQKLAERLGERRRNRLSGYRIAAACLLFALIIPAARLFQDRHGVAGVPGRHRPEQRLPPVATSVVRRPPAATVAKSTNAGGEVKMTGAEAATSGCSAASAPARRTNRNRLPLLAAIRVSPALIVAAPPDSANQSVHLPGFLPDVRLSLRTKELRVVHQNEIRGGNMPSPSVGATSGSPFINIQLHPWRQQPASVPSPAEDPALLKIKLSPSN